MKKMTCKDMGGSCDAVITGNSVKEMTNNGMTHIAKAHPELSEQMKSMPKAAKEEWSAAFQEKWDATPDAA